MATRDPLDINLNNLVTKEYNNFLLFSGTNGKYLMSILQVCIMSMMDITVATMKITDFWDASLVELHQHFRVSYFHHPQGK
jgi:hypothetical protein